MTRVRLETRILPATRAALDATGSPSTTAGRWLDERAQDEAQRLLLLQHLKSLEATFNEQMLRAAETQTPGQSESDQASGDSQSAKTRVGVTRRRGS